MGLCSPKYFFFKKWSTFWPPFFQLITNTIKKWPEAGKKNLDVFGIYTFLSKNIPIFCQNCSKTGRLRTFLAKYRNIKEFIGIQIPVQRRE